METEPPTNGKKGFLVTFRKAEPNFKACFSPYKKTDPSLLGCLLTVLGVTSMDPNVKNTFWTRQMRANTKDEIIANLPLFLKPVIPFQLFRHLYCV